jgi:hypothetical protein
MGLMRWMRGDDSAATSVISAGLAELDALFRPSKHKQTEHVEESKRKRIDVANGAGVNLDQGTAVVRARPGQMNRERSAATRTPYTPRRRSWWRRMRMAMHRRRRARALNAASADKS